MLRNLGVADMEPALRLKPAAPISLRNLGTADI